MKFKNLILSLGLLFSSQVFAQNEALPMLVKQALEYSPKVKEQQQLLEAGDYRLKVLESNTKPQINGETGYIRLDPVAKTSFKLPNGSEQTLQFQPNNNFNTNVNGSYVIHDWGKFKANVQKTLLDIQQQKEGIESLKHGLAYQVTQLFYSIVYIKKAIAVQEDQLKLVEENGEIIADKIKNGDALEFDALQVKVRSKNAELRLVDLKGQLEKQFIFLSFLTGSDARKIIGSKTDLNFNFYDENSQSSYNEVISGNLDLKILQARENALQQDVKVASMAQLPQLAANAALGVRNGFQPNIEAWRLNTLLGVKLIVPIYTGKRGTYNTQIAKINLEANKQNTEFQKMQINRDIQNALNDINVAKQKKELAAQNILQAEYTLKLAKVRLENGVSTPLEIQAAETGLEESKFSLLQYDYQALMAKIEIAKLAGLKFW